jgi:ABC-type arginine transport system ATPase subunit
MRESYLRLAQQSNGSRNRRLVEEALRAELLELLLRERLTGFTQSFPVHLSHPL